MKLGRKKIVFKNINLRITAILVFLTSLFIVWNWQVYNEPTTARFLVKLQPKSETILQDRDLSVYDFGGRIDNSINNFEISAKSRELAKKNARDFIFKHWQEKKRAYIILEFGGVDNFSEFHVFIEPNSKGEWKILWRKELSDFERGFLPNISNEEMSSVEYKIAAKEDSRFKLGTSYLIFLDNNGEEVASL